MGDGRPDPDIASIQARAGFPQITDTGAKAISLSIV